METYKKSKRAFSNEELAGAFIFPDVLVADEREEALAVFRNFREKKVSAQSIEEKHRNSLLQLKYLLEDYLNSSKFDDKYDFAYFLDQYIIRLEMNYKDFASDIAVLPSTISQIIGKHRRPTDKIIYRLHIHSNKNFPAKLWYRLLEKQKMHELETDKSTLEKESRHVKHSLEFSF